MRDSLELAMSKLRYNELKAIENDLTVGVPLLRAIVSQQLQKLEDEGKCCATCGQSLKDVDKPMTLLFGPSDFKKKASFCALDCLSYFTEKLRSMKKDSPGEKNVQRTEKYV